MSALYAHRWGRPWTDGRTFVRLTGEQRAMLVCADDASTLERDPRFQSAWDAVDAYIRKHGATFFRLASVSPKDAFPDGQSPCAATPRELFAALLRSERCTEELMDDPEAAVLVLSEFDGSLAAEEECRAFVVRGVVRAVRRMRDCAEPDARVLAAVRRFVEDRRDALPDVAVAVDVAVREGGVAAVVFVELNPMDEELDQLGVMDDPALAESDLRYYLNRPALPLAAKTIP
jgi:hypothetical protein